MQRAYAVVNRTAGVIAFVPVQDKPGGVEQAEAAAQAFQDATPELRHSRITEVIILNGTTMPAPFRVHQISDL